MTSNIEDILRCQLQKHTTPEKSVYAVLTDFLPSGVIDALSQIKQDYEIENPYGEQGQPSFSPWTGLESAP